MACCKNDKKCCGKKDFQDVVICSCMGILLSDVLQAINLGATTVEKLSEQLGVGTGCGACLEQIRCILKTVLSEK